MYGAGLRLMECLRLRVKDVDLDNLTLTAHDTKSNRDRVTFLPSEETCLNRLREHINGLRRRYEANPGLPVSMPPAPARKYRSAATSWQCFYLFPGRGPSVDPRTRQVALHTWMNRTSSGLLLLPWDGLASARGSQRIPCGLLSHTAWPSPALPPPISNLSWATQTRRQRPSTSRDYPQLTPACAAR